MEKKRIKLSELMQSPQTKVALYVSSTIMVFLSLIVLYKVPYNGDDMLNCLVDGGLKYSNRNLLDHTLTILKTWIDCGRFFPLSFYGYGMFSVFSTLFLYRTLQILLNMLVILSFGALVRKVTSSDIYAIAGILLSPVFFQFRYYQDPILGYHVMLQLVALYLIWAVFFQVKAMEINKARYLFVSAFLYAFALLTYEFTFAFILLFLLLPFFYKKGKQAITPMLPFVIVTMVLLATTLYIRAVAPNATYAGITISVDLYGITKAFLSQLSAAIPLSYWLLATPTFLSYEVPAFLANIHLIDVVVAILASATIIIAMRLLPKSKVDRKVLFLGLMLWILPATILSISQRYQIELSPGVGYLPVYVQYFGGILIAMYIAGKILEKIPKQRVKNIVAVVLVCCFAAGFLLTQANNRSVQQFFAHDNRQAMTTHALQTGLMENVPTGAELLVIDGGYGLNLEPGSFVYKYADELWIIPKRLEEIHQEMLTSGQPAEGIIERDNFYVFTSCGDLENGIAQIAKIERLEYDPVSMTVNRLYASEMQVMIYGNDTAYYQFGQGVPDNSLEDFRFSASEMTSEELPYSFVMQSMSGDTSIMAEFIHKDHQADDLQSLFSLDRSASKMISIKADEGLLLTFPLNPV